MRKKTRRRSEDKPAKKYDDLMWGDEGIDNPPVLEESAPPRAPMYDPS